MEKELNLGQLLTVGLGYALGIAFGLIVAATTSGGHLNPAVTLTFAITGRFPWRKVPQYWFAQSASTRCSILLTPGSLRRLHRGHLGLWHLVSPCLWL